MSFSNEDKKKVFAFFEKLLMTYKEPVYYELLRGHVSKAEPVVREYVRKKCKGEDLLKFFKNRQNYFEVDFRNEVSLKKRKSKSSSCSENTIGNTRLEESSTLEDSSVEEVCISSEYSDYSRSNSVSSMSVSDLNLDDTQNFFLDDTIDNERNELNKKTLQYFLTFLRENDIIDLSTLKLEDLPDKIQNYISKYMKNRIVQFFLNNSKYFYVENNLVTLVNPPVSVKNLQNANSDKIGDELIAEKKSSAELEEEITIDNFLACAEFFAAILKKKFIPLKNLRGHISQASPNVKDYMKLNYENLKQFILENDKLFLLNDLEEVSLAKDAWKLIKQARKLSQLKSDTEFSSSSIRNTINSLFRSENKSLKNNIAEEEAEEEASKYTKDIEILDDNVPDDVVLQPAKEQDYNKPDISCHAGSQKEDINRTIDRRIHKSKFDESIYLDEQDNVSDFGHKIEKSDSVCNGTKELSEKPSNCDESAPFEKTKCTQKTFIEFAFTAQLLCLEVVEKEYTLCLEFEYEAVRFFVEILERLPEKSCSLQSLRGNLGQASRHVNSFMKELYKGEKVNSFFIKHEEFIVNSSLFTVKLSPSYSDFLEKKKESHVLFLNGKKLYSATNLYNSHLHDVFADVLDCILKICSFLQNKSKIKFKRLNGIFSKFSASQQDFINLLNGTSVTEKFENFLRKFLLFDFSEEYIQINPGIDVSLLVNSIFRFSTKLNMSRKYDKSKSSCFDHLYEYSVTHEKEEVALDSNDLKNNVIEPVQLFLSYMASLDYYELVNILGYEVIASIVLEKGDSQSLIKILEESNLFNLQNGKVSLKIDNAEDVKPAEDDDSLNVNHDYLLTEMTGSKNTDLKSEKAVVNFDTSDVFTKNQENNEDVVNNINNSINSCISTQPEVDLTKQCKKFKEHSESTNISTVISSNSAPVISEFIANMPENTEEKNIVNKNKELKNSEQHSVLKIHEMEFSYSDLLKEEKGMSDSLFCEESDSKHIEQNLQENDKICTDNEENVDRKSKLLHDKIDPVSENILSSADLECKHENGELVHTPNSKTNPPLSDQLVSSTTPDGMSKNFESRIEPSEKFNALFLQPLSAKVILITVDSCIVETFINGCKKYVFCLKSSFHCDEHSDCVDCFDSLAVGDTISCYVPPSENLGGNNMCFSFMFSKDSPMRSDTTVSVLSPSKGFYENCMSRNQEELPVNKNYTGISRNDATIRSYEGIESAVRVCQTDLTGDVKPCFPVKEKDCQAECVLVSQDTQTVESPKKKYPAVEKECQVDYQMSSKDTQTVKEVADNECQTILSGKVKVCLPVCDNNCQTNIIGNIRCCFDTVSSSCQTELSGQVQKSVILADSFSQTRSHSSLVSVTTQTESENVTSKDESSCVNTSCMVNERKSDLFHNVDNASTTGSRPSSSDAQKIYCDTSCQTVSTGRVMITKYYLHG